MDSDNITDSKDDWKVLKSLSVNDDLSKVVTLGSSIETGVDNLDGATVETTVDFVWEGGIDDNTISMLSICSSKGSLSKFDVVVSLSLGFLSSLSWS